MISCCWASSTSSSIAPKGCLQLYCRTKAKATDECRVAWPHLLPFSNVLAVAEIYLSLWSIVLGQGCAQLGCPAWPLCGEGNRPLEHSWELRATIVLQCNFKVVRGEAFYLHLCKFITINANCNLLFF